MYASASRSRAFQRGDTRLHRGKPRALRLKRGRFTGGIPSRPADSRLRGLCFRRIQKRFLWKGYVGEECVGGGVGLVEAFSRFGTAEVDAAQAVQDLLPLPGAPRREGTHTRSAGSAHRRPSPTSVVPGLHFQIDGRLLLLHGRHRLRPFNGCRTWANVAGIDTGRAHRLSGHSRDPLHRRRTDPQRDATSAKRAFHLLDCGEQYEN